MSAWVRRGAALLASLVLIASAGACVRMPDEGPIVQSEEIGAESEAEGYTGYTYDPLPPQPDAAPSEIVRGFLDAMMAAPVQANSARQFLTQDAQASWSPERATITYAERGAPVGNGSRMHVELPAGGDIYDSRGAWQGSLGPDRRTLDFEVVSEDGEWRIAEAPDAMVVSEQFFQQRFRSVALYYFDPTARILVPEPVFVPGGDELATTLVDGLIAGPAPGLKQVMRSFVPVGLDAGLSVPVADGVADIALVGAVGRPAAESLTRLVTQLAWTLRQVPGIEAFRLRVGDVPVQLANGDTVFSVESGAEFDPGGYRASAAVFGLNDGRLVSGLPDALGPVTGPFGVADYGVRSVAVDLDARTAAAVTTDGARVLSAPVTAGEPDDADGSGDPEGEGSGSIGGSVRTLFAGGQDLLDPVWDFAGRLWLVERTASGARVHQVMGGRVREVEVPGITGADVSSFLVSRDSSRLVAVVRRGRADVLAMSRLRHDEQGLPLGGTRARLIRVDPDTSPRIRDLAWQSPATVAALTRVAGQLWEVRTVSVDGAASSIDSIATLEGRVLSLAATPGAGPGMFVVTGDDEAIDISGAVARPLPIDPDVTDLGYVG
ncbi:LpqB family beta-propeller domain-containing protein [Nocardioides ochotonae]|uniref:LpqB family beta-propeller domain-containing protein n=1 Tax=Nocardioides ochotonae TaxID=2685869 RepID=UPI0014075486|nr:LpqB family beta-propeller domain-containing protein [Nocardioides ochotonae]